MLKKTAFNACYTDAKLVNYNGWELPVQFNHTMLEEHLHVRTKAGVFDVSHMGEFKIQGAEATEFLNAILSNNIEKIAVGQVQYNLMCNATGGVIDDLIVYNFGTYYLMVVNAGNIDKDFDWVKKQSISFDVEVENVSEQYGQLAIQGPLAEEILQKCVAENLADIKFFYFKELEIAGKSVIVSRTGYTGEDGFEIYCESGDGEAIWKTLFDSSEDLWAIGLGARDTLRVEAALPLYGHELHDELSPLAMHLSWAIRFKKKSDFIGKSALLSAKELGLSHTIIGLETTEKVIPREGMELFNEKEKCVGHITSGCFSPSLNKTVAIALIGSQYAETLETYYIRRGRKMMMLHKTAMPFFVKKYKK